MYKIAHGLAFKIAPDIFEVEESHTPRRVTEILEIRQGDPAFRHQVDQASQIVSANATRLALTFLHNQWPLLVIPGLADFLYYENCIYFYPKAKCPISSIWFQVVVGVWFECKGLPVLHCAQLVNRGKVYAFCGPSGTGKSTLAATLVNHFAWELWDDEQMPVIEDEQGFYSNPGSLELSLWKDSCSHCGQQDLAKQQRVPGIDKYLFFPKNWQGSVGPLPIGGCFFLERMKTEGEGAVIEPISGSHALMLLLQNIYSPKAAEQLGKLPNRLSRLAAFAEKVPTFVLRFHQELSRLKEEFIPLHCFVNQAEVG